MILSNALPELMEKLSQSAPNSKAEKIRSLVLANMVSRRGRVYAISTIIKKTGLTKAQVENVLKWLKTAV